VPLDSAYPRQRLDAVLRETAVPVVLGRRRFVSDLERRDVHVVLLDDLAPDGHDAEAHRLPAPVPENLAYIIHTSGSSGPPKGVQAPHRALLNHAVEMARLYGLSPADRVLQFASLSFDVAAEEIFPTLLSGATLVLRPDTVFVSVPDWH